MKISERVWAFNLNSFTNAAVLWGRDHEQIAIDAYLLQVRRNHPPLTIVRNGFIINEHLLMD
jgi:hypothetical protein